MKPTKIEASEKRKDTQSTLQADLCRREEKKMKLEASKLHKAVNNNNVF
jgi:hypothetical protein